MVLVIIPLSATRTSSISHKNYKQLSNLLILLIKLLPRVLVEDIFMNYEVTHFSPSISQSMQPSTRCKDTHWRFQTASQPKFKAFGQLWGLFIKPKWLNYSRFWWHGPSESFLANILWMFKSVFIVFTFISFV